MILPPRIALQLHVNELREQLAAAACPVEREDIVDDLHDALDRLHDTPVPGAISNPHEDRTA